LSDARSWKPRNTWFDTPITAPKASTSDKTKHRTTRSQTRRARPRTMSGLYDGLVAAPTRAAVPPRCVLCSILTAGRALPVRAVGVSVCVEGLGAGVHISGTNAAGAAEATRRARSGRGRALLACAIALMSALVFVNAAKVAAGSNAPVANDDNAF